MSATRYFYLLAIIICLAAVYYIYQAEVQPQPQVNIAYNSVTQIGIGYVNNTLGYPIEITSIYCTIPNGNRQTFGTPNNNTLMPGTNTVLEIGITHNTMLALNCTDWSVSYTRLAADTKAPNIPVVQKT